MKVTEAYNGINTSFKKLSNNIVKGSNKELSPHTEALIDNIKETLENIQYGIKQPEQSEEVKNFKGNKDVIKNKEHFKGYFNKLGMSIRWFKLI